MDPVTNRPPPGADVQREQSDDRWARWAVKNTNRDFTTRRRLQIIAGVIGAGLIAWFMWTL